MSKVLQECKSENVLVSASIAAAPVLRKEAASTEAAEPTFEWSRATVMRAFSDWEAGRMCGAGRDAVLSANFSADCVLDASAPTTNTDGYRVYRGVGGCGEWIDFLTGIEFPDFQVLCHSPGPDPGKVLVKVSYTPTVKATGKTGPLICDLQEWTVGNGKVSAVKFYWGNPAALDALFATSRIRLMDLSQQYREGKEFTVDEVRAVLGVFRRFDSNGDGFIDESELKALCEVLMIEDPTKGNDSNEYVKDGKLDPKEFFSFYVGCTKAEAARVFVQHSLMTRSDASEALDALRAKGIKEWSEREVKDVVDIFKHFDADGNGFIDEKELQELCKVLVIEADIREADTYMKDGKIDVREFFRFYVGCTDLEAQRAFEQHSKAFC